MQSREEKNKDKQNKIINEEKKEKIKKQSKIVLTTLLILFVIFSSVYYYSVYIATKKIIVKEYAINNNKIPDSFNGKKIIHISDLHYGSTMDLSDLDKIIDQINIRKPDIIVFTGDLIDKNYKLSIKESEKIMSKLKSLNATISKYAITGEEDKDDIYQTIMNQSDFIILNNNYDLVYDKDNNPILITGIANDININEAFKYFKEETNNMNIYSILLLHNPKNIDKIINTYSVDLVLAGHTHTGQIKIPLIGNINTNNNYLNSYYQKKDTSIYISSGLGTSDINIRFNCHPSINFYRLRK